jgi:hypothetical protein
MTQQTAQVTAGTLKVPGAEPYYEVRGSGRPVLLCLPGGLDDAALRYKNDSFQTVRAFLLGRLTYEISAAY